MFFDNRQILLKSQINQIEFQQVTLKKMKIKKKNNYRLLKYFSDVHLNMITNSLKKC